MSISFDWYFLKNERKGGAHEQKGAGCFRVVALAQECRAPFNDHSVQSGPVLNRAEFTAWDRLCTVSFPPCCNVTLLLRHTCATLTNPPLPWWNHLGHASTFRLLPLGLLPHPTFPPLFPSLTLLANAINYQFSLWNIMESNCVDSPDSSQTCFFLHLTMSNIYTSNCPLNLLVVVVLELQEVLLVWDGASYDSRKTGETAAAGL